MLRFYSVALLCLALVVIGCGGPSSGASPAPAKAVLAQPTVAPVQPTTAPAQPTTAPPAAFPVTIKDASGQEHTFKAPPKLGSIWYGVHETLADFGMPAHAAGMTAAESTSAFYAPNGPPGTLIADSNNPELWAAAGVDLLLTRVPPTPAHAALKSAAPIFYLHHPSYGPSSETGYQAYLENIRLLGQITGRPADAQAALDRFDAALKTLRGLATPETKALKVAVLFADPAMYRATAPGSPFCVVLADVGLGQCVGEGAASSEINAEQFLTIDPDWIVYQSGASTSKQRTDPVWPKLKAVQAGRVYDALGNRYYCCSTRGLIHALQEYVHYVVPAAGIPAPGPVAGFDPRQSPLVTRK